MVASWYPFVWAKGLRHAPSAFGLPLTRAGVLSGMWFGRFFKPLRGSSTLPEGILLFYHPTVIFIIDPDKTLESTAPVLLCVYVAVIGFKHLPLFRFQLRPVSAISVRLFDPAIWTHCSRVVLVHDLHLVFNESLCCDLVSLYEGASVDN